MEVALAVFSNKEKGTKGNQSSCLGHTVNSLKLTSVAFEPPHVQTSVSGQVLNWNFCKILNRVIFISSKPIFMPMQPRGPAPKGRYAKGCRSFLASSVNLEGAEMETSSRNVFCSWFHVFHLHLKRWLFQLVLMDRSRGLLTDYVLMGLTPLNKQIIDLWLSAFVSWWFQERTDRHYYKFQCIFNELPSFDDHAQKNNFRGRHASCVDLCMYEGVITAKRKPSRLQCELTRISNSTSVML